MQLRYNISFDICAIIIFIVLLVALRAKKTIRMAQNKVFFLAVCWGLFTAIIDILSVAIEPIASPSTVFWFQLFSFLYYIGVNVTPFLYALYVVTITDGQKVFGKISQISKASKKTIFCWLVPPIIISIVIIFGNIFTGWLFSYDMSNGFGYSRGFGIYVLYAMSFYFMFFAIIYIAKYHDVISFSHRMSLYFFFPVTAIPVLVQAVMEHQLLSMLGISISLFLIFISIQSQGDMIDPQTGLFNKNAFLSFAPIYYRNKQPFVIISIVLSNYRFLVETFGIMHVSTILSQLGVVLLNAPATKDKTVFCLSETSIIIMVRAEDMTPDTPMKIRALVRGCWTHDTLPIKLDPKLCVFDCPTDAETVDILFDCLEVERERRGHYDSILYSKNIARTTERRVTEVGQAIRRGLLDNNFEVYYQGIYSPQRGNFNSGEALLRLKDPILGNVSPNEFITIAERDGSIIEIGNFVFDQVCQFISSMNIKEFGLDYIEINLSVAQCMQEQLAMQLLEKISQYGIPTEYINLEITETVAAHSFDMLENNMTTLANAGIKFSLDDYGTGYSSMMSMVELPFHYVKIDRGIVAAIEEKKGRIAVGGTIAMLKEMNLKVVAEGVETLEQVNILIDMGCDYLQGFYYSMPVPKAEFLSLLTEKNLKP